MCPWSLQASFKNLETVYTRRSLAKKGLPRDVKRTLRGANLAQACHSGLGHSGEVTEKQGQKQREIEVYVGSRPELQNGTQNDGPDLDLITFSKIIQMWEQ